MWEHDNNESELKAVNPNLPSLSEFAGRREFRFCHPRPRNVLEVFTEEHRVVVVAARDNFSERDKFTFVRHLALEGFIPSGCRWCPEAWPDAALPVEWESTAPAGATETLRRRANAFMVKLFLAGGLAWVGSLALRLASLHLSPGGDFANKRPVGHAPNGRCLSRAADYCESMKYCCGSAGLMMFVVRLR